MASIAKFALSAMVIFLLMPSFAQTPSVATQDSRIEAIESRRIAFLTEKLELTPEEARVFWPVYNEYNKRRNELTAEHRNKWHKDKVSEMSNEEAGRYSEDLIIHIERNASIKREYHERLKRILPARKIALLYEAEREFNRILFQEARRRSREGTRSNR